MQLNMEHYKKYILLVLVWFIRYLNRFEERYYSDWKLQHRKKYVFWRLKEERYYESWWLELDHYLNPENVFFLLGIMKIEI